MPEPTRLKGCPGKPSIALSITRTGHWKVTICRSGELWHSGRRKSVEITCRHWLPMADMTLLKAPISAVLANNDHQWPSPKTGSTPTAFRQFSARFRRPSCLTGSSVYLGPFQQKQRLTRPRRLPDQRSPLIPKRTPARRLPATRRPAMVGQQHAHSVLAGITGQ